MKTWHVKMFHHVCMTVWHENVLHEHLTCTRALALCFTWSWTKKCNAQKSDSGQFTHKFVHQTCSANNELSCAMRNPIEISAWNYFGDWMICWLWFEPTMRILFGFLELRCMFSMFRFFPEHLNRRNSWEKNVLSWSFEGRIDGIEVTRFAENLFNDLCICLEVVLELCGTLFWFELKLSEKVSGEDRVWWWS
jgi:hypothetical protein